MARITKAELAETVERLEGELATYRSGPAVRVTAGAIPTLAGLLGWVAGDVGTAGSWLAVLPAAMAVVVLSVSLPHVSAGIASQLAVTRREAWSLAAAVDLSMIAAEVVIHCAPLHAAGRAACWAVMAIGLIGSTYYNVRGFRPGMEAKDG